MNRSHVATWCLSLGVLTSLLNAQPVSSASGAETVASSAVAPESARITGRVTDSSGRGMPSVVVLAEVQAFLPGNESTTTDAAGRYSVAVAPGVYRLKFTPGPDHVIEHWPNARDEESATDIVMVADQTVSGIEAQLATAGHIAGTISPDVGTEFYGQGVIAYRKLGDRWILESGTEATSSTFRIDRLPAGTYRLEFRDFHSLPRTFYAQEFWPDARTLDEATTFSVAAGATVVRDARLARTGTISGIVRGPGLTPLHAATVTAYEEVDGQWVELNSDGTDFGAYEIVGLDPGDYRLRFAPPTDDLENLAEKYSGGGIDIATAVDVRVKPGGDTRAPDALLVPGASISGEVTFSAPPPLPDWGGVAAYRQASNGQWMQSRTIVGVTAEGRYELVGVNPGTYRVEYFDIRGNFAREFFGGSEDFAGGTEVVVPPVGSGVTGIDLDVQRAGRIQGRVYDPRGERNVSTVTAYRWNGEAGTAVASTRLGPRSDGSYDFGGLAPGRYRVGFSDRDFGNFWANEYWPEAPSIQQAQDIVVRAGQTETGKDVTLSPGIRTILAPAVRGRAQVGSRLSVDPGHWSPLYTRLVYQWLADGDAISGAVSPTYSPTARDLGKRISVRVAGQRTHWVGVPVRTAATQPIGRGPIVVRDRPRVTGKPVVGQTLRVAAGRWDPAGVRLSYAWFADREPAGKGARLVLTQRHRGDRVTVRISAASPGYRTKVLTLRVDGPVA